MATLQNVSSVVGPDTQLQDGGVTQLDEYLRKRADLVKRMENDKSGESIQEWYNSEAVLYEQQFDAANFAYPLDTVKSFMELVPNRDARILDVAAGTGKIATLIQYLIGQKEWRIMNSKLDPTGSLLVDLGTLSLQKEGYKNIDALDGSEAMLELARRKGLYINTFCCLVGTLKVDEIDDGTYDAIIMGGSMSKGHLTLETIPIILRMIKEGGFLTFSFSHWNLQFADFSREKINETIEMLQTKKLGYLVSEKSAHHRFNEEASIFNFKRGPYMSSGF